MQPFYCAIQKFICQTRSQLAVRRCGTQPWQIRAQASIQQQRSLKSPEGAGCPALMKMSAQVLDGYTTIFIVRLRLRPVVTNTICQPRLGYKIKQATINTMVACFICAKSWI
jgi:hypothetical protein